MAKKAPAVGEVMSAERQGAAGGWEPCHALGLRLEIRQLLLVPERFSYVGAWVLGKTSPLHSAGSKALRNKTPCLGCSLSLLFLPRLCSLVRLY